MLNYGKFNQISTKVYLDLYADNLSKASGSYFNPKWAKWQPLINSLSRDKIIANIDSNKSTNPNCLSELKFDLRRMTTFKLKGTVLKTKVSGKEGT